MTLGTKNNDIVRSISVKSVDIVNNYFIEV